MRDRINYLRYPVDELLFKPGQYSCRFGRGSMSGLKPQRVGGYWGLFLGGHWKFHYLGITQGIWGQIYSMPREERSKLRSPASYAVTALVKGLSHVRPGVLLLRGSGLINILTI